ncbi:MAG TPA: STAS domain-containing protein [Actinomycetota bacterium]|nr:STAS domain-containing protein [Actinomycetota bacterium]
MTSPLSAESDRRIGLHRRLSATPARNATNEEPFWIEPGPIAGNYLLGGRLDKASADHLDKLVPPPGAIDVTLDVSAVTFIDSSGIGSIIQLASRIDRVVVITRPSAPVRASLEAVDRNKLVGIVVQD